MWVIDKRSVGVAFGLSFTIGAGLAVAGVLAPAGAKTDDGHPLDLFLYSMAAFFSLGPVVLIGGFALSNWREAAFIRDGIDAKGLVLAVEQTGTYVNEQPKLAFRLRVEGGGGPPYEVEHRQVVSLLSLAVVQPGAVLDVKVSRKHRNKLLLLGI